ncbi:MAG: hypothetical protein ACOX9R_08345 [Armatimonadota bacterium]|jgi:hypothetical protein
MEQVEFQPSRSLLRAVLTRQAGDWRKGLLELVQNAIDATRDTGEPRIEFTVNERTLTCSDNGVGIGDTREDIIRRFAVFGDSEKRDDDATLGHFGIGRGQTLCLIWSPELDRLDGRITVEPNGFVLSDFRVDDELGFTLSEGEHRQGTTWIIRANEPTFDADEVKAYLREHVLIDFPVLVNGEDVRNELSGEREEYENAILYLDEGAEAFALYERGLKVNDVSVVAGWGGTLITKVPLKLDMSRTQVQGRDPNWQGILRWVRNRIHDRINDLPKDARLTDSQRGGILSEIGRRAELARMWGKLPLVRMTNDRTITLQEASKKRCYFSSPGSALADRAIEKGLCVVPWHTHALIAVLESVTGNQVRDVREAPEVSAIADEQYRIVEPQVRERECLDLLQEYFDLGREYRVGINPQAAGWTDGRTYVAIERSHLRRLKKHRKHTLRFLLEALDLVAHEHAHDRDDRQTMEHGVGFERRELEVRCDLLQMVAELADEYSPSPTPKVSWKNYAVEDLGDGQVQVKLFARNGEQVAAETVPAEEPKEHLLALSNRHPDVFSYKTAWNLSRTIAAQYA